MIQRTHIATVLAALLLVSAVAPATVAAEDDEDSTLDALLSSAEEAASDPRAALDSVRAAASGLVANAKYRVLGGDGGTPEQCTQTIREELNANAGAYESYINDRVSANTDRDVVAITCEVEDDGDTDDETVYVVADANTANGTYENLSAVNTTERTVDHTVTLSGLAAEDLPDDLVTFREDYLADNETPPKAFMREMQSKYAGHVHGSFAFLPDGDD